MNIMLLTLNTDLYYNRGLTETPVLNKIIKRIQTTHTEEPKQRFLMVRYTPFNPYQLLLFISALKSLHIQWIEGSTKQRIWQ